MPGRVTAIRRRNAIVRLDRPLAADVVSGEWLLLTRDDAGARWRDPVELVDVRLYPQPPSLQSPTRSRQLASRGTMRLVRSGARGSIW